MKRLFVIFMFATSVLFFCIVVSADETSFTFGSFGRVFLYKGQGMPRGMVIFISGDGGWNKGVVDMARTLSRFGVAVVGVDITHYLHNLEPSRGKCMYPAADFEALSKYVQKRLDLPRYTLPILVGYSSGAALVYAVLAQAPPNTFRGGISMGFCPDLTVRKPLCQGYGLVSKRSPDNKSTVFLPDRKLSSPWIVLQGMIDRVCSDKEARLFVSDVPDADIVSLPYVGHGFSVERNWLPEFKKAFDRLVDEEKITSAKSGALDNLPLIEVPAHGDGSDLFAVIISGDGGWASLDRDVGGALAQRGIPVVGLNALQYFWTKRTPEGASEDLARILRHYLRTWTKNHVLLVGYSLGADVLPFMTNRLPLDLLDQVREIALLGPGKNTEFEFHITEWLGVSGGGSAKPVLPEVEKLRGRNVICLYGAEEAASLCPLLRSDMAKVMQLPDGHHFGGKYELISDIILKEARIKQLGEKISSDNLE
jgi:type IV secretory pathway VirJ component